MRCGARFDRLSVAPREIRFLAIVATFASIPYLSECAL
jgi:hypothetical protein